MTAPVPAVSIYLPTTTAVTSDVTNVTISRGRRSPLFEEFTAGTASAMLNNQAREWDPLYTSGTYYGEIVPGRRATITATPSGGSTYTLFDGRVSDWSFDYDRSTRSVAIATMEDGLAKLARTSFDEWTSTFGEYPGARLTTALARPEVDYGGSTSFDTGLTPLASDLITWNSNVLNYLQLIARTDLGYLFITRAGVLRFIDRHGFIGASSAATIGTGGIGFSSLTTSYGKELLFNYVTTERVQPAGSDEVIEPVAVSDATSITDYDGTFVLSLPGLLFQDNTTATDHVSFLLSVYKDPLYRFESVSIDVHGLSAANQAAVLALDIGSVVTVTFTPNGVGTAISRTCIVEGVEHRMMPAVHEMTLTLNDANTAQTGNYWTVEDATYGTIGAGGALDYPVAF